MRGDAITYVRRWYSVNMQLVLRINPGSHKTTMYHSTFWHQLETCPETLLFSVMFETSCEIAEQANVLMHEVFRPRTDLSLVEAPTQDIFETTILVACVKMPSHMFRNFGWC